MKHRYLLALPIEVQGEQYEVHIVTYLDKNIAAEMRDFGYDINRLLVYIPDWAVNLGLAKVWEFCSDVFNFRNPFARKKNTVARPTN